MFAIIRLGSQQFQVRENDLISVNTLPGDAGETVSAGQVLSLYDGEKVHVGRPIVQGAAVEATIVRHGRGRKIRIHKFKRRKGYARTMGHRQGFTELRINKISLD